MILAKNEKKAANQSAIIVNQFYLITLPYVSLKKKKKSSMYD